MMIYKLWCIIFGLNSLDPTTLLIVKVTCQRVVGGIPNFSDALVNDNDRSRNASRAASISSFVYDRPFPQPKIAVMKYKFNNNDYIDSHICSKNAIYLWQRASWMLKKYVSNVYTAVSLTTIFHHHFLTIFFSFCFHNLLSISLYCVVIRYYQ